VGAAIVPDDGPRSQAVVLTGCRRAAAVDAHPYASITTAGGGSSGTSRGGTGPASPSGSPTGGVSVMSGPRAARTPRRRSGTFWTGGAFGCDIG